MKRYKLITYHYEYIKGYRISVYDDLYNTNIKILYILLKLLFKTIRVRYMEVSDENN